MNSHEAKGFLAFAIDKDVTYLYKRFLEELEELRQKHGFMLTKLTNELPPEYHQLVRAANYMDDVEFSFRRKKILDAGNDAKRALAANLAKYKVDFDCPA